MSSEPVLKPGQRAIQPVTPEDFILLHTLLLAVEEPKAGQPRPGAHTIALFVQRGWLALKPQEDGSYKPALTRAGSRELDQYRRQRSS